MKPPDDYQSDDGGKPEKRGLRQLLSGGVGVGHKDSGRESGASHYIGWKGKDEQPHSPWASPDLLEVLTDVGAGKGEGPVEAATVGAEIKRPELKRDDQGYTACQSDQAVVEQRLLMVDHWGP